MKGLRALLRHLLVWWLPLPIALVVLLSGFALWLTGTQVGTRTLLGVVADQFDGQVENVNGTILGELQVGHLQLALPGTAVDLTDLRLDIQWSALGRRLVHVRELSAGSVQIDLTTAPNEQDPPAVDEPFVMPELPVKMAVDRFAVDELHVTMDGDPLPVAVKDVALSLGVDAQGAQLNVNSLHVAHADGLADVQGKFELLGMAQPWPLRATLNANARGTGPDSPLCASRMLTAQPQKEKAASSKTKVSNGNGPTTAASKTSVSNGNSPTTAASTTRHGKAASSKTAARVGDEASNPPQSDVAAVAADVSSECAATLQLRAEGSLDQMDVYLDGATADGALKLLAQAGLAFDQPFPLRTANLNVQLANESSMVVTLDRQPLALQPGLDRVVATLDAKRFNIGDLLGDVIPPALLSATMAVDAQVENVYDLKHALVQATIAKGSRWNNQALAGSLTGRIDAGPATATQGVPTPAAGTVSRGAAGNAATPPSDPLAGYQLRDLLFDLTLGPNRVRAEGELSQGEGSLSLDANTPRLDAFWPDLPGGATLKGKLAGRLDRHQATLSARYTPSDSRADTLGRAPMQADIAFSGGWGDAAARRAETAPRANTQANASDQVNTPTQIAAVASSLVGWRGKIDRFTAGSMNFTMALQPTTVSFLPQAHAPNWQWEVGATQLTLSLPDKQRAVIAHQGSRGGEGRWQTAGRVDNLVITRSMLRQILRALDPAAEAERQQVNGRQPDGQRRIALDAAWDLQFAGALSGTARVARRDGDLRIPGDPPIPLGLTNLTLDVKATPTGGAASRLDAVLDARTKKMGTVSGSATAVLAGLALDERRPMRINLDADIVDLTWVDLFVGDTMEVRGKVRAKVDAQGTLNGKWNTAGTIQGQELRVVRIDDGVRLLNGTLNAHLDGTRLVLDSLRFPASLRVLPDEWRTREWVTENPDAKGGYAEATGQWDLQAMQGAIHLKLHRFPALQRSDRYAMVSGTVDVDVPLPRITITGDLTADAGWFSLEVLQGVPSLDDDVRVIKTGEQKQTSSPMQMSMDLKFDMGRRFYITGMGLDAGLLGSIRILMADGRLTGLGALHTRGGGIEAYGQRLQLRRGTLTFQGRLDNPVLDIEALRTGGQVEAGVRVSGTAQRPRIDLVSYPDVSDVEKLSWLVLGRGPDGSGSDAALLLSIGAALLGGGEPFYRQFGLDDVSIRSGAMGSSGSLLPDRTVATEVNTDSYSDLATQFIVASKHFANGITLSVEQAMSGSDTVGRASYALSRRWSLDLKGGAVNGLALVYRTFFAD